MFKLDTEWERDSLKYDSSDDQTNHVKAGEGNTKLTKGIW